MPVVGCVVSTSKRGLMLALLLAGANAALVTLALCALVGAPNRFPVPEYGFAGGGS
jgi:invasion protein IalB